MVDARVWKQVEDEARQSPVRFLEHLLPLKGWRRLSEAILVALRGVRDAFTIDTEAGEIACVLHPKIPNVPTCRRETVER